MAVTLSPGGRVAAIALCRKVISLSLDSETVKAAENEIQELSDPQGNAEQVAR